MARSKPSSAAVQPSAGKKITFGEDEDDFDQDLIPEAGPSKRNRPEPESDDEDEEDEDSDDEAPEAVGVSKQAVEDDAIASAANALAEYVPLLHYRAHGLS
jgi:hypothetical protein